MKIEEVIFKLTQADSVSELFTLYENYMAYLGFDHVLLALITDHVALKQEAQHGVLFSYPEDWVEYYLDQVYDVIDPVRHHICASIDHFSWNELIQTQPLSKKQKRLFNEAEEAALFNGIGIPLRGPRGAIAGIGACSSVKDIELSQQVRHQAFMISQQFYVCYWRLMELKPSSQQVWLTDKEQDILRWAAHGFSRLEIGAKLKITENTIDYHIKNILRKLDVRNITAAVVIALNLGFIQV